MNVTEATTHLIPAGKHSKATDGHHKRSTNSLYNGQKDRLHRLDVYLGALEGALVRGESTLSPSLAAHLASNVQGITAGMLITDALDVVFAEQEGCLAGTPDIRAPAHDLPTQRGELGAPVGLWHGQLPNSPQSDQLALSEAEARDITVRIRTELAEVCTLLLQAHDGSAWSSLGYPSWEQYVRMEFGLSRSRSYELLNQGLVRRALQVATNNADIPHVSARAAASLKPVLIQLTEKVRESMAIDGLISRNVISSIIRETLARMPSESSPSDGETRSRLASPLSDAGSSSRYDLESLADAVEYFAALPPAHMLVASIAPGKLSLLSRLPLAAERLADLSRQWSAQRTRVAKQARQSRAPHTG